MRQNEKEQDKEDKGKKVVECKDKVVRRKGGEMSRGSDSAEGREIKWGEGVIKAVS